MNEITAPEDKSINTTKSDVFSPTPHMIVWLDTAIRLVTDSPTDISNECGIDRTTWYQWVDKPGFEDWYFTEYKNKRKRWLPTLDAIGMKNATKDYNYWKDMNKKVGELEDKPNVAVQVNNVISEKKGEYGI